MIKKCYKCQIELSNKNLQYKSDNQCRQCKRGSLFCTYTYDDPELELLAKNKSRALSSLINYRRHHQVSLKRHNTCHKCGVTICDKNFHSWKQCVHCMNNSKSCRVKYPDDISYKITRQKCSITAKNRSNELTDSAVKNLLRHVGYKSDEISSTMIEIKRKQVIIKRKLKNQGIWVR